MVFRSRILCSFQKSQLLLQKLMRMKMVLMIMVRMMKMIMHKV